MAIKLTTARQSAVTNGIKCLVYGPSGVGKTSLIKTAKNPLIISAESGLLALRDTDIPVIEVRTVSDVHEAYQFCTSEECAGFDWICLDSISEIAEVCLVSEKAIAKDPRQAYGALSDQVTELVRAFRDLPGKNVYFAAKQERVKDELTGAMLYSPSMPGQKLGYGLPYFFDEVFCLRAEKDETGTVVRMLQTQPDYQYSAKDRSGALDAYEIPDLSHIQEKIMSATTNQA